MPLPGHCWWVKDEYGRIWNESAFYTHVHVWYYRKALMKEYPQFQFRLHFRQKNPSRPVLYHHKKEEFNVKERKETIDCVIHVAHETEDF